MQPLTWLVESKSCIIVMFEGRIPTPSSRLGIAEASSLPSAITATEMFSMLLRRESMPLSSLLQSQW